MKIKCITQYERWVWVSAMSGGLHCDQQATMVMENCNVTWLAIWASPQPWGPYQGVQALVTFHFQRVREGRGGGKKTQESKSAGKGRHAITCGNVLQEATTKSVQARASSKLCVCRELQTHLSLCFFFVN